ncbi:Cilia- and flagella-associated protein 53 [Entophlyctis luteolus]|nr:Cilia- and flagella-associated protein 53 [Entophlyctis luteolus]
MSKGEKHQEIKYNKMLQQMALINQAYPALRSGAGRSDFLIVNRRREEEQRNRMKEATQYYKTSDLVVSGSVSPKRPIVFNLPTVNFPRAVRLRGTLYAHNPAEAGYAPISANEGRARGRFGHAQGKVEHPKIPPENHHKEKKNIPRLRALLVADDAAYAHALAATEDSREAVLAKMKARRDDLKARRETERKKVVEAKLLQRWRSECDDLRTIESKVLEKKVAIARGEQLSEHQRKKESELEEKRFYDQLWEQDRQKKIAREVEESDKLKRMNEITVAMLNSQMQLLREQQAEEERLKQEEAYLMRQELATRQLEDERERQRKLHQQQLTRSELDKFNTLRMQARAAEHRAALDDDIELVNNLIALDEQEKAAKSRRREELRREMNLFREHLLNLRLAEKEREDELLRLEKAEAEKLWSQRAEKWQAQQRARDRLMVEVLAVRRNQLLYAIEENRNRQEKSRQEREQILKQIEHANHVEALDKERKARLAQSYRESLEAQMEQVNEKKREQRRLDAREELAVKMAEKKYQELLGVETDRAWGVGRLNGVYTKASSA